jgi:hypothetical protein
MNAYKLIATFKFLFLGLLLLSTESFSQGGGGGGPRRDPSELVAMEKQVVLDSLSGINADQKLIIEEIYKDYEKSITTLRANADPDNREAMRTNMTAIRDGKNESLKAILTEEQYQQFDAIMKVRRENMGQRRRNNGGQ